MTVLELHPDRALPADPQTRTVARRLLAETERLPLVCMHGHVDSRVFAGDTQFADPASLLVVPDHYVTRMLVSQGLMPEEIGIAPRGGGAFERDPVKIWRRLCEHWHLFRGTPSRYWLEYELVEVFGVSVVPSASNADSIYDQLSATIAEPGFRPLALLDRFGIELIATTDPATSALEDHAALAGRGYGRRIVPTFRPDDLFYPDRLGWADRVQVLGERAGVDTSSYDGFLTALGARRRAFAEAGALASDHGHLSAETAPLPVEGARKIFAGALGGTVQGSEAQAFASHMLFETARMACEDGLVMQLHSGVLRDHDTTWAERFGADTGFDIPVAAEFTRSLRPLLEAFGRDRRFRLVLFTTDETTYSRELAPLAGAYPSVLLGPPWWFLDSPEGMRRFREAATETAGFYNLSGFVDDTRAFLSIPARHDLSRRVDAGYLAKLVVEHRMDETEAAETAVALAYSLAKRAYARRETGSGATAG